MSTIPSTFYWNWLRNESKNQFKRVHLTKKCPRSRGRQSVFVIVDCEIWWEMFAVILLYSLLLLSVTHGTTHSNMRSEVKLRLRSQPIDKQSRYNNREHNLTKCITNRSFFEIWSTTPHPPNFPHWNLDPTIWHSQIILPRTLSPTFNTSSQLFTPNLHLKNSAFWPSLRGTSNAFGIYYQRTNVFQTIHLQEQLVS